MSFYCNIGGIDWANAERMKYWSFPKSYSKNSNVEIKNLIFSGEYYGSLKRDGYWCGVYKNLDGEVAVLSRSKGVSGEYTNHYEKLPHLHDFFKKLENGTVLIGELYLPSNEQSRAVTSILGCLTEKAIDRQVKEKIHLYVFDVWALHGESFQNMYAIERFNKLNSLSKKYTNEYVDWAVYYNGAELWTNLQKYLAEGKEGMVITHQECPVYFKRTPARQTIKIKKELQDTIDCFFTGRATKPTREYTGKDIENWQYWENTKTGEKINDKLYENYNNGEPFEPVTKAYYYNMAGSLEIGVFKNGEVFPIGYLSGLTDEIKSNPIAVKNKVIEVICMQIDFNENMEFSGLRHAKMVRFRDDIDITECTFDKIF